MAIVHNRIASPIIINGKKIKNRVIVPYIDGRKCPVIKRTRKDLK